MSREKVRRPEAEEITETDTGELEELKKQYKDIVEFEPAQVQVQTRNLRELKGKHIIVHGFELLEHPRGELAILTVEFKENNGLRVEKFHTFSKVIVKQLKAYEEYFRQGKKLLARVTMRKGKGGVYLSLDRP